MLVQTDRPAIDAEPEKTRPIELLTENGFSIVRSWELDGTPPPTIRTYEFRISAPQGAQQRILVTITEDVLRQLAAHVRPRVESSGSFWVCCAERHLTNFLDEGESFPPGHNLILRRLDPEEIILAMRWGRTRTADF